MNLASWIDLFNHGSFSAKILSMDFFDILKLLLILACGPGLMFLLGLLQKRTKRHLSWSQKTILNAIGSVVLALPIIYLGLPFGIVSIENLGVNRFVWWWLPASLGFAVVLILLNAGIALGYQKLFRIDESKLVSFERANYFNKMSKSKKNMTLTVIFGGIIAPLCEELYFRGLLLSFFLMFFNPWIGIAATSIVFGLAHFDSVGVIVTGIIDGVALSLVFIFTGSLWVPVLVHIFNNSIGLVAFAIENAKVKDESRNDVNTFGQSVSNDCDTDIIADEERQACNEEEIQIRPDQDTAC